MVFPTETLRAVWEVGDELLYAFAKLQKATISFVSVRPYGTNRLPLDGFTWNLIFCYFSKICREFRSFIKSDRSNRYVTWRTMLMYW